MQEIKIILKDAIFTVFHKNNALHIENEWQETTHFHADNEIHIVFSGKATIEIDGKDVLIGENDICFLAPNLSHYPKQSNANLVKTDFSFRLSRNYSYFKADREFSEFAFYDKIFKSIKSYALLNEPKLVENIKQIININITDSNEHIIETLFASFFINLGVAIKSSDNYTENQTVYDSYISESSIKQRKIVEEFFQNRYNEMIGIQDLASELCLSIPQTHRIVKKIFSVGFKKTLTKQRITHACMLIKSKNMKITDIAEKCGYDSYNGFLSAFKTFTGKTPKEYEKCFR